MFCFTSDLVIKIIYDFASVYSLLLFF